MVRLINGRGQLGEKLQHCVNIETDQDIAIYHTWKITFSGDYTMNGEDVQKNEYNKLVEFSKNNPNTKIIFVSTNTKRSSHYAYYKELAEAYLLSNHPSCVVLRFPTFIGKGILPKIKSGELEPYGVMELITLDKVAKAIEDHIFYEGFKRTIVIEGERIEAKTILEILKTQ
jgi:hypothetical protein